MPKTVYETLEEFRRAELNLLLNAMPYVYSTKDFQMPMTPEEVAAYDAAFKQSAETINHPLHYGGAENPYETIKVIKAWGLDFALGNAVECISRASKSRCKAKKKLEDLKKARWYLDEGNQGPRRWDVIGGGGNGRGKAIKARPPAREGDRTSPNKGH